MKEDEVIIVNGIDDVAFDMAFRSALNYALLSLPFTFNRLNLGFDEIKAILERCRTLFTTN